MKLILGTFLFSVASALIPVLNAEAYLAYVAARLHSVPDWQLACVAGAGQTIGKIIWFYAGRQTMRIPWLRRKMQTPKWQASYDKWHARIVGRPAVGGAITFASAFSGFPPLAVIAVLVGSLRMNFPVFLVTTASGRILRFWVVLAGVGLVIPALGH